MKNQILRLYEKYTQEQLVEMDRELCANPETREKSKKKREAIMWAIWHHSQDKRRAAGLPTHIDGYSGRNSNKR